MSQRFAWYGRVSNADLQNPSLSFPSQLKACERRVRELGGEVVAEFRDEESGAHSDRPGWTALLHEAKDVTERRFDTVIAYSTSRVSRKQFDALFYERELRAAGVEILFATGAPADPTSAEGILQLQIGRAFDEWVVAEDAHLPIVSDKLFEAAQERFDGRVRSPGSARAKHSYLFSGMVRCCSGHNPLAMQGKVRKGHHYYACAYANSYGEDAAVEAHAGQKWLSLREDRLLKLVLRFFDRRVFGPMRVEKLERQMRAQGRSKQRDGQLAATRIRKQIADLDRRIKAQVLALEEGIEPNLVAARISELRGDKAQLEEAVGEMDGEAEEIEDDTLTEQLERLPDLSKSLREAPPHVQRQVFEAFDLRITYDKPGRRVEISATVSEAVADAFENAKALRVEGSQVVVGDIAGAGFEPATFGL